MLVFIFLFLGKPNLRLQSFTTKHIDQNFDYREFIDFLQDFYCQELTTPDRQHFEVNDQLDGTMLIMPCWAAGEYMGVKLVNVFPQNKEVSSINGIYILMSRKTGECLAQFDGLSLTTKRTAAVSALAAKILRQEGMRHMLMLGTGNLSGELIKAHASVQRFEKIGIWGRDSEKMKAKALELEQAGITVEQVNDKDAFANGADLISTATLAEQAILNGKNLKPNVYVDLVGSYNKESREADDAVMSNAEIYVDTFMALKESGDLYLPLKHHVISKESVRADIVKLSQGNYKALPSFNDKVVFKSVGFAASDLACAAYLMTKRRS